MKTIIAGSRTVTDYQLVLDAVRESGFVITEVVSGCARGVDQMAIQYAHENNIPVKLFPAEWDLYGKGAGHIRNKQMAEYADALVAIHKDGSRGTRNMIGEARLRDLKVFVKLAPMQ